MSIWLAIVLIVVAFLVGFSLGKSEGIKMAHIALTGKSKLDDE